MTYTLPLSICNTNFFNHRFEMSFNNYKTKKVLIQKLINQEDVIFSTTFPIPNCFPLMKNPSSRFRNFIFHFLDHPDILNLIHHSIKYSQNISTLKNCDTFHASSTSKIHNVVFKFLFFTRAQIFITWYFDFCFSYTPHSYRAVPKI